MQEMAESSEQHRVLTEQKTQLTAELDALTNSMDRVCWLLIYVGGSTTSVFIHATQAHSTWPSLSG